MSSFPLDGSRLHGLPHQLKIRNDKLNIAQLSVSKLARIADPQTKLRKAVLINNTLKNLQKHSSDLWSIGVTSPQEKTSNESDSDITEFPDCKEEESTDIVGALASLYSPVTQLEKNTLSDDMLNLCDDIINDILGNNNNKEHISNIKEEELSKEPEVKEDSHQFSPYSYNSFLSELYTMSYNNQKLQT